MKIKVKVLYEQNYKNDETFDKAIEGWEERGWIVADSVYSFSENLNAVILYKDISEVGSPK